MPSLETLIMVIIAGLALSASPGPSMLYVLSRSLGQSRNAGLVSSAGLALGGMVHAVAAALGLSVIFNYLPVTYVLLQVLGAIYLLYLGYQMVTEAQVLGEAEEVTDTPLRKIFLQGIMVEVLNPKTILFFVAFIPQFVNEERGSVPLQMLILGMLVPLTAVPSDIIVSFTGGSLARKILATPKLELALRFTGGAFLVGLGLYLGWGVAGATLA